MLVVIRADASQTMGSGHIMRCLTLAERLRLEGAEVSFVCRDFPGNLSAYIRDKGFAVHLLPSVEDSDPESIGSEDVWLETSWISDAEETLLVLRDYPAPIDWLIVDHYGIDHKWEAHIRQWTRKIMVIDDLANRRHDCDMLLDQNLSEDPLYRYLDLVPKKCKLLLGPLYALIRPQFAEARDKGTKRETKVKRLLVFYGGSDLTNETWRTLNALDGLILDFDVVIGSIYKYKTRLTELIQTKTNVSLHCNVDNMAELMLKADLSIGASGSVSWERCCVGLPAILISVAKNQEDIAKNLERQGCAIYLGKHSEVSEQDIRLAVELLVENPQRVTNLGLNARRLVDGYGTNRVSRAIWESYRGAY